MNYEQLKEEVKTLITESLKKQVNDYDTDSTQSDSFAKVACWITDVMALGNNKSLSEAIDDVFEIQSDLSLMPVNKNDLAIRMSRSQSRFIKEIRSFKTMLELHDKNEEPAEIINKIKQILDDRISVCIKDSNENILIIKEKIKNVGSPWHTACQVLENFFDNLASEIPQNTTTKYKVYFTVPEDLPNVMNVKVLFKNVPYQKTCGDDILEEGILPYQMNTGVPKSIKWKDSPFKKL